MKKIFYQNTVQHDQDSNIIVTFIMFDNTKQVVTIQTEEGRNATSHTISMGKAMDIGLINLNALHQIWNSEDASDNQTYNQNK
jgi:hypothetical protein